LCLNPRIRCRFRWRARAIQRVQRSQRAASLQERKVRIARFGAIHENNLPATVGNKTSRLLR
jgi:hypothetical protein